MPRDILVNALSHPALRRQGLCGQARSRRRRGFMSISGVSVDRGVEWDGMGGSGGQTRGEHDDYRTT